MPIDAFGVFLSLKWKSIWFCFREVRRFKICSYYQELGNIHDKSVMILLVIILMCF